MSFHGCLAAKGVSMYQEPCITRSALIDLNPDEFNCYMFVVSLDGCNGSCNTYDNLSAKICVLNKTEGVNVKVFNIIVGIN